MVRRQRMLQRREFLRTGTHAALAVATPAVVASHGHSLPLRSSDGDRFSRSAHHVPTEPLIDPAALTTLYDPRARELAMRALDAAHQAGAHYADVRCTNRMWRACPGDQTTVAEQDVKIEMSARALVNGYWGWASTTILSPAEAVRVGQLGTQLATEAATQGRPRVVDLGSIPTVHNGTWQTPLEVDPFALQMEEIYDWLSGVKTYLNNRGGYEIVINLDGGSIGYLGLTFTREERLFASSEGSLTTQTIATIYPAFGVQYKGAVLPIPGFNRRMQGGWECLARQPLDEIYALVQATCEAADRKPRLSFKPAELGRYDIVYSAAAMAEILGGTLVPATELDRTLGYEANASGTSYLGPDPLTRLGTPVASPVVTLTAERSTPHAAATAKWDDEGVATEPFTLVKNGALVDYQTTREQAAWLAPWYQKQGQPIRSRGCAGAPSAGSVPMQHASNMVLEPSAGSADEEALIKSMTHGLYVPSILLSMDFQCANGFGVFPTAIEIRNGHPVARVGFGGGTATLFRSIDFWKNVHAVGGAASAQWFDGPETPKGNPAQRTHYSVCTVPALVTQQAVIDPRKKA